MAGRGAVGKEGRAVEEVLDGVLRCVFTGESCERCKRFISKKVKKLQLQTTKNALNRTFERIKILTSGGRWWTVCWGLLTGC